jgi:membrane protease YdiL (CAAX protease family)
VIPVRLGFWVLLVGAVAALNYAAYGTAQSNGEEIYQWSSFANGAVFYAVVLGLTLLLAIERRDLLALRRPSVSLSLGARVAGGAILAILVWEWVVVQLPVEDPGKEQGLTPTQWEPKHAAAFTANVLLFVALAPFVEELLFRGLGQSLLRATIGAVPAVLAVGLAFGAWHGLLWALLVLVPFGWALAFVRERTDSVYPGMIVHALFNAFAIAASVLS